MTADLVTWLNGALDEDNRAAEACINEVGAHRAGEMYSDGSGTADYDAFPSYPWGSDAAELAYMAGPGHPARVLAEVAAKRQMIDLVVSEADEPTSGGRIARQVLLALARPYAGRAGFDPSWLD